MAEPELNVLLHQGATLCNEMADLLEDAKEEVEVMVSAGDTLDEGLHDEVGELRDSLRSLTTALQKARGNLDGGGDGAENALKQLAGRAESVADDSVVLVNAGQEGSANVEEAMSQVGQMLDSQAELLTGDFDRLGAAVGDLSQAVSDHVEEAEEALENFSKGLSDAHTDLAEHRSAWLKAVDDLTTEVIDSTKASFDGMVELLKAQGTALLGLGNSLVDSHNRNLEPVDRMFSEEAVQSVTDVVDPLVQELTNVTQQAASRKDQFSEKAQTILNSLEALIPEIENLTIQLRTTQGL